ncbi:TrkH family potassium uptake protein [Paraherbaspirillum soli]|uniref:TrkH family potassium uptake protein n=1 Tax=Paraherbaspirillum soli TaxID=631222 RepID=A0ABW0MH85_9BURK
MRPVPPPKRLLLQAKNHLLGLAPPQFLTLSFVLLALAGTLLLKLPLATHTPISWLQAMFTATSASTVTGLIVLDTGTQFTLFGQSVLIVLMQCGGLGLMAFGVLIIHVMSGQLALRHRTALREALNQSEQADMRRILGLLFGFTISMELLGTALLALHWVPQLGWSRGLFYSFFHAISAFNNAGFSLQSDNLASNVGDPLINIVITGLLISGGIGFVVVADMLGKSRFRDYSLHTKLMLIGTLALNLIAMLVILVLEYGNPATLGGLSSFSTKLWAAWFQAVTPRTAGFNTIDIQALLPATAFFIMGLMFIGGGSGSTASGIKLSTFMVLLLATRAFLRQRQHPVVFGRSLDSNVILRALAITVISLFCVITGTLLLTITEKGPFLDLAFEVVSAFGTAGLSRGLTADLSMAGQCVIMLLMLIGRVGPLTLAFTLANPHSTRIKYPVRQVNIG